MQALLKSKGSIKLTLGCISRKNEVTTKLLLLLLLLLLLIIIIIIIIISWVIALMGRIKCDIRN
jgi:hypothetical protein